MPIDNDYEKEVYNGDLGRVVAIDEDEEQGVVVVRFGQASAGELEQRIVPQAAGIVAVLVPGGDHQQAEAQHVGEAVSDPIRRAWIVDASGETFGQAEARLNLAQRQQAAVGGEGSTVEAGDDRLALDG
jgi:hypothetical protein